MGRQENTTGDLRYPEVALYIKRGSEVRRKGGESGRELILCVERSDQPTDYKSFTNGGALVGHKK